MKKAALTYHLVALVMVFVLSPGETGRAQGASDRNVDLARFLPNHGNSVYQDAVFGFSGQGKSGSLQCTDFQSGKLLWERLSQDWSKDQQLVIADGLIFAITKKEELVLAEAGRDGYRESSRFPVGFDLGRPQQPTLANGRLYLRGNQVVACYQVAGKKP